MLLAGLAAGEGLRVVRDSAGPPALRTRARALLALLAVGLVLEIAQGVYTPLLDRSRDIIVPLLWPAGGNL